MTLWHEPEFFIYFTAKTPAYITRYIHFSLTHALHPTGHDYVCIAGLDLHHTHRNSIKPGTTAPVHNQPCYGYGPARFQKRHTRAIGTFAVLICMTHYNFINRSGLYTSPADCFI